MRCIHFYRFYISEWRSYCICIATHNERQTYTSTFGATRDLNKYLRQQNTRTLII